MKRRLLAALLCVCLLFTAVPFAAWAEGTINTGTVYGLYSGSILRVRKEPSTSAAVLDKLSNGATVTVLGQKTADGIKWYNVRTASGVIGWASSDYIRLNNNYQNDEEFEAYLTAQGFPESYKEPLRKLYAAYPNWEFQAAHLSMTWAEALEAEGQPLKNALDMDDFPESWLSMEYGTYNWSKKEYVAMDSGGCVTASPYALAYYMDPRNFLDSTYIFQFEDLLFSSKHTLAGVQGILPTRFDGYAADLLKAAKDANVNAYFLATRMRQEGSKIDGTFVGDDGVSYKGYYNFFNFGSYAGSQHGEYHGAVTNGAINAKKQGWDTPYKCIFDSAESLGKNYIHKKQNTTYYQKFNVAGDNLYNHQYMSNINAPAAESKIRSGSATEAELKGSITFIIPVYKDMPDAPAPKPSEVGNNNNFLDSLTVEGCTLTPSFSRYELEYATNVGGNTAQVTVAATPNNSKATIKGTGTIRLKVGENLIPITVTATSGEIRTYTLSIIRDNPNPDDPNKPPAPKPTISGKTYKVDKVIYNVKPDTKVAKFIENLAIKDGAARVCAADGTEKTEGTVGTGNIVQIYDNDMILSVTYPIVVNGDVNGDSKVSTIDLRMIQKHILGILKMESAPVTAADVNGDGKVSTVDLRMIQKFILGSTDSLQIKKGGAA